MPPRNIPELTQPAGSRDSLVLPRAADGRTPLPLLASGLFSVFPFVCVASLSSMSLA